MVESGSNKDKKIASSTNGAREVKKKKKRRLSTKKLKKVLKGVITGKSKLNLVSDKDAGEMKEEMIEMRMSDEEISFNNEDDLSTVYGVEFESSVRNVDVNTSFGDSSTIASTDSTYDSSMLLSQNTSPLQYIDYDTIGSSLSPQVRMVVVLMNPPNRRFEILSFEFNENEASVKICDVYARIPGLATEPMLQDLPYTRLCFRDGCVIDNNRTCNESSSWAFIALTEEMDPIECAKLAKPIFANKNVTELCNRSDIDMDVVGDTLEHVVEEDINENTLDLVDHNPIELLYKDTDDGRPEECCWGWSFPWKTPSA